MQDKDSGSFVNGFGIGLLAGVAAYFLFGTDQGKDLRKKILNEWDSVQANATDATTFEPPKQLRQVMTGVLKYFAETLQEVQELEEKISRKALPSRSKTDPKVKSSSRFKGV